MLDKEFLNLKNQIIKEIQLVRNIQDLENLHLKYLGRKQGKITLLLKKIPELSLLEKKIIGPIANSVKKEIEELLEKKKKELGQTKNLNFFDITVPGQKPLVGHLHPVTQVIWEMMKIAQEMGYEIREGPEIENEWYNFEALNIPKDHPARDLQDTFWLTNGLLPRTHTSAMQVKTMEKLKPPFKIAVPGWVYRCENEDATHGFYFHHFEFFAVGKGISFSDLKGTLYVLLQKLLGKNRQLKFRASYFPYVEPCAEVSVSCDKCNGKGCRSCGGSGWLELLGSGMIHPKVLKNAGIDPDIYSGFAFCPGPGRIAMIKYGIKDFRLYLSRDLRFLEQF